MTTETPKVPEYRSIEIVSPVQVRMSIDQMILHLLTMKTMGAEEVWIDGTGPDRTRFREFGVGYDENNQTIGVIEIDLAPNAVGHPPHLHPPTGKGT